MDGHTPSPPCPASAPPGPRVARRVVLRGAVGLAAAALTGCSDPPSSARDAAARTPPSARPSPVEHVGTVGDGVADDTAAVQALIDASARTGATGVLPAGTYRCTSSLLLPAGTRLHLSPGSRLWKDWVAPPGPESAFLRNADFSVKSDSVRLSGPGTIGAVDHDRTGVVLALYGDDVRLSDFAIDTYAGGQAVVFAGDRGRVDGVHVRNSAPTTGTGGIRVVGGSDFLATACHVESGDDCLQFAPIGARGAVLRDLDVTGGRFVDCTGASSVSRFMVATLEWTRGEDRMTASVRDCSFRACRGRGTGRGIVVKNTHSSGSIERLSITDCTVDVVGGDERTPAVRVHNDPTSGGSVRRVALIRTSTGRPVGGAVQIDGPGISDITLEDCTFPAPTAATAPAAVVDAADRVQLLRCSLTAAPGGRLLVVGPGAPVTDLSVEACSLTDIGAGTHGIELVGVAGARVTDSVFRQAGGVTDAGAVRVAESSSGVVVEDNDLTGLSSPRKVTDRAGDTVVRGNRGA
jgi:pectate lyase-like protein